MIVSIIVEVEGGGQMAKKVKKPKAKPKKNIGPVVSGKKGKK
jgi:hypothetical protein